MTELLLGLSLLALVIMIMLHISSKKQQELLINQVAELRKADEKKYEEILQLKVGNEQLQKGTKELQVDLFNLQDELGSEREKNRNLLSQKKSSETRLGQISEHLIPFLATCPYDPKNLHFLGNPIDYIMFDFDEGTIVFLEVKSGNSKPSKRQKTIKNIIKSGRIFYEELRINEKGIKLKRKENES